MPIYEYVCRACGEKFPEMRRIAERNAAVACRSCGSEDTALAFSVPGHVGAGAGVPGDACGMEDGGCCGGMCMN